MRKEVSADSVVKDIRRRTRRKYSAEEKIRIVLEGLRGEDSIAEPCRRGGYARQYDPRRDDPANENRNNLIFVTQRGYNYDRPRKKGEGNDWGNTGLS